MPLISKLFCVRRAPLTETLCELRPRAVLSGRVHEGARRERENLQEVARRERQLRDRARVNDAAQLRAVRLDERRGAHDDRLDRLCSATVSCALTVVVSVITTRTAFEESRVESVGRDAHAVRAGRKQRHGVVAFRVGCDFSLFGGGEACDGHFRSDDDGAVRVFDSPGDAARGLTLGESGDGVEDKQATDPEQRHMVSGAHALCQCSSYEGST